MVRFAPPQRSRIAACVGLDGLLVIHAPAVADDVAEAARSIDEGARGNTKPVVAVLLGGADGPLAPGSSIPAFMFPEQAAAVLGRSHAYGRWLREEAAIGEDTVRPVDPQAAHEIIGAAIEAFDEAMVGLDLTTASSWPKPSRRHPTRRSPPPNGSAFPWR